MKKVAVIFGGSSDEREVSMHTGLSVVDAIKDDYVVIPIEIEEDYKTLGLDVGVYYGERKEFDKQHTICTWQSLNVLLKKTKKHTRTNSVFYVGNAPQIRRNKTRNITK